MTQLINCCVCFSDISSNHFERKWNCFHENMKCCKVCSDKLDFCPVCRNTNEYSEFLERYKNIPDITKSHLSLYYDDSCIRSHHDISIKKPYGVLILCNDCKSIKCYNYRKKD